MLAIRMQRTGRRGHANFRVVVQDSRQSPASGKVVALLGSYDPHTKTAALDKEKAEFYLKHGAQPSERTARLLKSEGVKLPKWVEITKSKKKTIRNAEKLRKNRPAGTEAPKKEEKEASADETPTEAEKPAEEPKEAEAPKEEKPEEPAAEVAKEEAPDQAEA